MLVFSVHDPTSLWKWYLPELRQGSWGGEQGPEEKEVRKEGLQDLGGEDRWEGGANHQTSPMAEEEDYGGKLLSSS